MLGEQRLAATVLLVVMLAGLCLIELLTLTMKTVPFTCTYLPGQLKLRIYWAPYLLPVAEFVFTLSNWSLWALQGNRQNTLQLLAFLLAQCGSRCASWHMAQARKIHGVHLRRAGAGARHDDGNLDVDASDQVRRVPQVHTVL